MMDDKIASRKRAFHSLQETRAKRFALESESRPRQPQAQSRSIRKDIQALRRCYDQLCVETKAISLETGAFQQLLLASQGANRLPCLASWAVPQRGDDREPGRYMLCVSWPVSCIQLHTQELLANAGGAALRRLTARLLPRAVRGSSARAEQAVPALLKLIEPQPEGWLSRGLLEDALAGVSELCSASFLTASKPAAIEGLVHSLLR